MQNEKVIFIIITLISSLSQIMSDLYLSSLPAISHALNVNIAVVQFSVSLYVAGLAISPLIYGPISDGIGRRKPLLFGLALCFVGGIICFTAQYAYILNIGRFLQGLGAGAGSTLIRPMLRDMYSGDKLAKYGSYSALISVGALAGAPILGGYLQHYFDWRASFIFLTLLALSALLSVLFFVPETNIHHHPENLRLKTIKNNIKVLTTNSIFMGYSFCWLSTYAAILAWLTASPVVLENIVGISPIVFGWSSFLTCLAFAVGAFINGRYVSYFGIHVMLQLGLFCIFFAGVVMFGLKLCGYINAPVIVGPAILVLFGAPLIFPNAFSGAFQPFPKIAGIAGGLFECIGRLGGVIGSGVLALSDNQTQLPMATAFIISALLAWCIFHFLIKKN